MARSKDQTQKIKLGEFNLIAEYFAPLATTPGALGLLDDGAVLTIHPDQELITTTDMLISSVHFLENAEPEEIATRLLAVNVSDLAAMGATPMGYLLVTALTAEQDNDWLSRFAQRLKKDQIRFGMVLYGGDTVATPGPLSLTLTAFGTVPKGQALKRSSATIGDQIYVSGTLGDSALGLMALRDELPIIDAAHRDFLINRFQAPQPRVNLGQSMREIARGVADISDGFVADLNHICEASQVGAKVFADDLPLSDAAKAVIALEPSYLSTILTGGDDYELVFMAPSESQAQIDQLSTSLDIKLSRIGVITEGKEISIFDSNQKSMSLDTMGYKHF